MEVKKSYRADLEHRRPWMFLAGFVLTMVAFVIVLEWKYIVDAVIPDEDDSVEMDLDMNVNDEREWISAAQKMEQRKEEKSEIINKVDETTEMPPETMIPEVKEDTELEDTEDEPPVNLNEDDPEIMRIVEELPQFPGGMAEFVKWLTKELKYPPTAQQRKIKGKVIVSFIVNIDGSISDVKLENRVSTYLDNEALRVIRKMPTWTPGKDHGKVCRTKVAVPIVFDF